jgi:hypothetical protein
MKNKHIKLPNCLVLLVLQLFSLSIFAQNVASTQKIGQYAFAIQGAYGQGDFSFEKPHVGYSMTLKYFNTPKACFTLNHTQLFSSIDQVATSRKYSMSLGFERHFVVRSFSPYVGLEGGLNFIAVGSDYLKGGQNEYFINNLPLFLARPKVGMNIALGKNLAANVEYVYHWSAHSSGNSTNALFVNAETSYVFSRKTPYVALGLQYTFGKN